MLLIYDFKISYTTSQSICGGDWVEQETEQKKKRDLYLIIRETRII